MKLKALINSLLHNKYIPILWTITIFILCTLPSDKLPQNESFNDKTAHFVVFAVFSFLWLFISQNIWKVLLWGIAFGIFIEFWQAMLPISFHRSGDIWDAVADAVGVVIGIGIHYIYKKILGD